MIDLKPGYAELAMERWFTSSHVGIYFSRRLDYGTKPRWQRPLTPNRIWLIYDAM